MHLNRLGWFVLSLVLASLPVYGQATENTPFAAGVWNACWRNGQYFDFTQDAWTNLAHGQQFDYATKYQAWYAQQKGLPVSKTLTAGGTSFEMMLIPPGRFWMGSPDSEPDRDSDEQRHRVTITKAYWLQKTELTQRQWRTVTESSPWSGKKYMENNDNWAAAYISWDDVQKEFLPKLGGKYRLPTEGEWEYACRAGTLSRFYWGESVDEMGEYANVADKTTKRKYSDWTIIDTDDGYAQIAPVGSLKPNGFGLHDMIGNVYEWCGDWYGEYSGDVSDPTGTTDGFYLVVRGGSWVVDRLGRLRSAFRGGGGPSGRVFSLGARLLLEAD